MDNKIQEQPKGAMELVIVVDGHSLAVLEEVNLFSYADLEGTSFFSSAKITILSNVHQKLDTWEHPSSYEEDMDMGVLVHFLPYGDSFLYHFCYRKEVIH